ncbi:large ribosomal subunit protein mL40 [Monosporozyma unispora]
MLSTPRLITRCKNVDTSILTIIRTKRTKANKNSTGVSPQMQRVVTQLSVMSARKKQPKMLKLSNEDLIKHQTIETAWKIYQDKLQGQRTLRLKKQYFAVKEAMDTLKEVSPALFYEANVDESGKTFPMELRVPTDAPPREIWHYDYTLKTTET